MLTTDQESFLADFADAGLAEQRETTKRNTDIEQSGRIREARSLVLADLKTKAQALIDAGLRAFDDANPIA